MKCLIIENGKGYFSLDGESKTQLDQISKDDLLKLLNLIVDAEEDVQMDEYDEEKLHQAAHRIIYRNLYQKFCDLLLNKTRFKDESSALYKSAIERYGAMLEDENIPNNIQGS